MINKEVPMGLFDKAKDLASDAVARGKKELEEGIIKEKILDKAKDIATNAVAKVNNKLDNSAINEKVSAGIMSVVDKVSEEREAYYISNSVPTLDELPLIIESYSHKNAAISGGAALVPGPLGMAAAIPEIVAVMKYQMNMVYDIAKAHGHSEINKELIIAVLMGGLGNGATGLIVVHGQKVMAKRVGARAFQQVVKALGGKITQETAKSMAAKWLPVAGAVAMATWSKYITQRIGKQAIEVFSKEIKIDDIPTEITDIELIIYEETNNQASLIQIDKTKIEIMINLMNLDGKADDKEVQYIGDFIDKSSIDTNDKMALIEQIHAGKKIAVDYEIFKISKEDSLFLLIDLIALAKVDGEFHITEKMYIKEIAKMLGFDENDTKELMN